MLVSTSVILLYLQYIALTAENSNLVTEDILNLFLPFPYNKSERSYFWHSRVRIRVRDKIAIWIPCVILVEFGIAWGQISVSLDSDLDAMRDSWIESGIR